MASEIVARKLEATAISLRNAGEKAVRQTPSAEAIAQFDAQLRTLYQSLRSHLMRELALRKLSYSASLVLFMVNRRGKATMGELQRELGLASSTITGLVDTLHGRGLVERYSDPEDRRVVYVRPTAKGADEVMSLRQKRVAWLQAAWPDDATDEELDAALRLIERLTHALSSMKNREEPDP